MRTKNKRVQTIPQNYMDKVPFKASERPWQENENGIVEITVTHTGFYARLAQKYFKKPQISYISLDNYGTVVWKNINGKNTIYDIVKLMEKAFPNEKYRMLERIVTYMAALETNKFVYLV